MKDVILTNYKEVNPTIKCLDHGYVKLVDCMPRIIPDEEESADHTIAEAARCSYQRGTKTVNEDKILIRYLMRHLHTSPFEMVEFKFHIKLPIFVARQKIRHRTASLNEMSGRYSEMPEEYYIPEEDDVRVQSTSNKQGSDGTCVYSSEFIEDIKKLSKECFEVYHNSLNRQVAREQARICLPLSTYTEWYWKMDLKNLLHFLDLRCDNHAQKEIRVYADAILELIRPIIPWTIDAWEDYSSYRGGLLLTRYEVDALRNYLKEVEELKRVTRNTELFIPGIEVESKFERNEWEEKKKRLLK